MLKALELAGFKSFADKTRFEFPQGITVIVGPNGSGKSNIVDAIKWVLGEQSAKSLRGKDMADVIFKGGGSGGRKPLNTAEATLVFDNSSRDLLFDADEVHVTRRVYRSGEGEYLINGQSCRLRDIKDLFRGTGLGTDAYSIIEQGKLDVLLQASARERRAIFEEAAGISRFKAKKIEAQRRLERVDQNMLRLSDIVEEVENRLRAVRSQASKAQRYKECNERLQQLRTQVGHSDWRRLTAKLEALEQEVQQLDQQATTWAAEVETAERTAAERDTEIERLTQLQRECDLEGARLRERIIGLESANSNHRSRRDDFEREAARLSEQVRESRVRAEDVTGRIREIRESLQQANEEHKAAEERLNACRVAVDNHEADLAAMRQLAEQQRTMLSELLRAVGELERRGREVETHLATVEVSAERAQRQVELLTETLSQHSQYAAKLRQEEQRQAGEAREADQAAEAAQTACDETQRHRDQATVKLAELQTLHGAARERAALLEDLDLRQEGVSAGAQETLSRAKNEPDGPFGDVCGLVADLIEVNVATAPLIDVALGDLAQYVVVKGDRLLAHIQNRRERFTGRVGVLPLAGPTLTRASQVELDGQPGVIGRADLMVETAPWFLPLVRRLLGDTWFVEKLSHAMALRSEHTAARFVTLAGELVESDGSLVIGPPRTAVGIISRRSELKALREQIASWDVEIAERSREVEFLRTELAKRQEQARTLGQRQKSINAAYAEQRALAQSAERQGEQLAHQREAAAEEVRQAQHQQGVLREDLQTANARLTEKRQLAANLTAEVDSSEQRCHELELRGRELTAEAAAAQIDFTHREHHRNDLQRRLVQFESDQQERGRSREELVRRESQSLARCREVDRSLLQATSELAVLYLGHESNVRHGSQLACRIAEVHEQRKQFSDQFQRLRSQIRVGEDRRHRVELAASELRHERTTLAERLQEDYGIDIGAVNLIENDDEAGEREAIDEEIAQLRRKLTNLGAVNLESLAEIEEVEQRFGKLSSQYQDLCNAKEALERIIAKINADSRRLFAETLDTIRQNFQVVFRKVFGGGRADIVLEEGADILEAGIEIIATPPGKQSLSISLLSGGERALTAVTLMLAIFQFRPSPFCILDEVDGPLDEANIGRFVDQLKEYLAWTKFVIVTHSKKTMTAATTLYGVTMQESGVSKRVSVKFDDVSESGHIRQEAIDREPSASASEDERAA